MNVIFRFASYYDHDCSRIANGEARSGEGLKTHPLPRSARLLRRLHGYMSAHSRPDVAMQTATRALGHSLKGICPLSFDGVFVATPPARPRA